jgi:hypothetical protein
MEKTPRQIAKHPPLAAPWQENKLFLTEKREKACQKFEFLIRFYYFCTPIF